ncbi:RMD2-like protein [Mya arenaria]|uniref:RMD2-like protein n=1 Tax=Mya arenaria TaxID=6604 RepID=A0ABY7FA11_MYAAR|nr:regulator of microtubule dynamics protein 1-like [Mya arenaria]WAR19008.1 RMD2-like protein [Mya arenaria]
MNFFRQHGSFLASCSAGAVLCFMYWRMTNRIMKELQSLEGVIEHLQRQVAELKEKVESSSSGARRRRTRPGSGFITASSGDDDDDEYEQAYGGSDYDSLHEIEDQIIVPVREPDSPQGEEGEGGDIFKEVDQLLEGRDADKEKAFDILQRNRNKHLTDVEYYWRISKTTFQISQIVGAQGDAERKKRLIYEAKDLAQTAIDLDNTCANAHKWFAITIGSVGEYEGTQQKIQNGYIYKEHIEKAISINPDDPSNHYLLGRWCWSVYMLSWLERKAAATLFATPPSATIDETLTHFLKADKLNPGKWKENILFIAKCYIEKRAYKQAVEWLNKGQQIPTVSQDDKQSATEITALLSKYQGY